MSRTARKTATRKAHNLQRGFIAHRDLTANIVEMDAYARLFAEGFPDGFVAVVEALYTENHLLWQRPPVRTLCVATPEVAQGCPLSGALFVAAVGPVLRRLRFALRQRLAPTIWPSPCGGRDWHATSPQSLGRHGGLQVSGCSR